jgi:hypothetical protein
MNGNHDDTSGGAMKAITFLRVLRRNSLPAINWSTRLASPTALLPNFVFAMPVSLRNRAIWSRISFSGVFIMSVVFGNFRLIVKRKHSDSSALLKKGAIVYAGQHG